MSIKKRSKVVDRFNDPSVRDFHVNLLHIYLNIFYDLRHSINRNHVMISYEQIHDSAIKHLTVQSS